MRPDENEFDSLPETEEILEEYAGEGQESRVILTDENGNEATFEFLDVILRNGVEYLVMLPLNGEESSDVVIFRVEKTGDEECYVGVDDEAEAQAVYEEFQRKNRDVFSFEA